MSFFQKTFGWLSRKPTTLSAPREQLLHTGTHPIVPFVLQLEDGQSSYFYNRGQSPVKGIHVAGKHQHDPENIPAAHYLVINRDLVVVMQWEVVRAVEDFVLQLELVARVQVADADQLAEYFAHEEKAQSASYLDYRLQKACEQWVNALSLAECQHFSAKHQPHFLARLQSALSEMGLEGLALEVKSDFHPRPTPAPQAPSTASLLNRNVAPDPVPTQSTLPSAAPIHDEECFYYFHLGQRQGPTPAREIIERIQRGELERSVCVWKMGMGTWASAQEYFGL